MAYVITGECISCGACEAGCALEAISAGSEAYVIDPDLCSQCGSCVDSCPVDAIQET